MRDVVPSHRGAIRAARIGLLIGGIVVTTIAFLGLVDEQLAVVHVAPWWWMGLAGMVGVLLGLGSPWNTGGPEG